MLGMRQADQRQGFDMPELRLPESEGITPGDE
jgi:hypothetical protein